MTQNKLVTRISGAALVPVLAFALGSSTAYSQDRDDHRDMNRDDARDHGRDHDRGRDFHFDDQHRQRFEQRYRRDADHWRDRRDRVHFMRGQRIPPGYRIQPVPVTYYRAVPPPPARYRYGYYEG
jgi:Ni/Co efflux regulator RcnB